MSEREINQKVAEEIRNTHRLNGQEFHLGDWVGLLDGKVVAVAKDIDSAFQTVRKLDADPHRGMILQVGPPVIDVIR
jgi:dihydroxyacetone kinase-like predicted kinase